MDRFLTDWIWTPEWTAEDDREPRIVYFRKSFLIQDLPASRRIRITADSRYKLYINGRFVQKGPQKALDLREWFVDTAELAPFLQQGLNVIAVEVLRYPSPDFSFAAHNYNDSLLRTQIPHLYVQDAIREERPSLAGRYGWRCRINRDVRICGGNAHLEPIHVQEDVAATSAFAGWKRTEFDDGDWAGASVRLLFDVPMADAPGNLVPRTIPPMAYTEKRFESVSAVRQGGDILRDWQALIQTDRVLTIPAHTTQTVELSAGEEECGYLLYAFSGGKGAQVATLCAECYAYPQTPVQTALGTLQEIPPRKGDRMDAEKGRLFGYTSRYTVAGYGTRERPEEYEPFAFRTFRYVQLEIRTADVPLTFLHFTYRETGYPLEVKTYASASDPDFEPIWDISVRTLRRCMHETYMDCPFYEQLQYAMDARSEILFTYTLAADDRLARQAMEAFRRSQRPDGLVNADAPTVKSNVIPGFSIYYLLMLHDHMMYFGDRELVKQHLPVVDGILAFFDRNRNHLGLVGKIGGKLLRHRYWSFVDWSSTWDSGVPDAGEKGCGSITMESLLYLYGLQHAAELAGFAGRPGLAGEYRDRGEALKAAIRENCMGEYKGRSMVQDGPGVDDYSVHTQVFAVLTGTMTPQEGRESLERAVGDPLLPQASVAFAFYLFRALEKCGLYEKTDILWELWRQMLRDNMTTCVENDTDARSDCHAWASLLCYELPAVILGVRPTAPGFAAVSLSPKMGTLTHAQGEVVTPKGMIRVAWERAADGGCNLRYSLPQGMEIVNE